MANYSIVTNNPAVAEKYANAVTFVKAPVFEVLTIVRNAIHKGAVLISHPQTGSLRPGFNPYKSIIITQPRPQLDFNSLRLIEDTLTAFRHNGNIKYKSYNENMLADFQTVDLDFIESALSALLSEYR